ncbi:unnamed protein product [Soboliphyme baturini]|uniref:Galectin n=1 Tax=Soboliphyme baturini TaxID=241478 RepID=A0A183J5B9_9BILA|nr:unnamed protein product [Soboliphyme baturini]
MTAWQLAIFLLVFFSRNGQIGGTEESEFIVKVGPGSLRKEGDYVEGLKYTPGLVDRRLIYLGRIKNAARTAIICFANSTGKDRFDGFQVQINVNRQSEVIRYYSRGKNSLVNGGPKRRVNFQIDRAYLFAIFLKDEYVRVYVNGNLYFDDKDADPIPIKQAMNSLMVQGFESGVVFLENTYN